MPDQLIPASVERWLDRGVALFNGGSPAPSIGFFSRAIAASPDDPRGYYFRSRAYAAVGRSIDAERDAAVMVRLNPGSSRNRLLAGEILQELRLPAKARSAFQAAARSEDGSSRSEAWLARARLEFHVGEFAEARRCVRKVLVRSGASSGQWVRAARLLEEMGDYEAAEGALAAVVGASDAASRTEATLQLARLRLWRGERRSAERLADEALRAGKGGAEALRLRGAAASLAGKWGAARADLDRAVELAPGDVEALVWRAEVRRRLGDAAGARADLLASEMLAPEHLGAILNLELLNLEASQGTPIDKRQYAFSRVPIEISPLRTAFARGPRDAEAALEQALRRMGGNRSPAATFVVGPASSPSLVDHVHFFPRDRLVHLQAALRFGQPERVLESFGRLARSMPREAYIYSHRGEVHLWLGRYEAARRDFERALNLNEALLWPKVGLGAVSLFQGRPGRALGQFEYASSHNGSESIVCPWLGEALRRLGRLDEAWEQFEKITDPMPFRPAVWVSRALVRRDLGDRSGMRRIYSKLRRYAPDFFDDVGHRDDPSDALESAMEAMRGNRSRWMYTYIDARGILKIIRFRGVDPATIPAGQEGKRWQFYDS